MNSVVETEPVRAVANAVARIRMSVVACKATMEDDNTRDAFDVILEVVDAERDVIIRALMALTKEAA